MKKELFSAGGNYHAFNLSGCMPCMALAVPPLPPVAIICGQVRFDPVACAITINPCAAPCLP